MSLRAGKRNHHITIEEKVAQGDGYTWQTFATAWAEKRPMSGREFLNGGDQVLSRGEGVFEFPWIDGVDPTMRIRDSQSRLYNIEAVLEDAKSGRESLTCPYSRGTNDG